MKQKISFLKKPNLPEHDVAVAAMSCTYPFLAEALQKYGVRVLAVPQSGRLSRPVSSHADMICHHLGGNSILVLRGEESFGSSLNELGFHTFPTEKIPGKEYPSDVLLNAARIGNKVLLHPSYVDPCLLMRLRKQNVTMTEVKQGYTKCSCALVAEHAIITSDQGIYRASMQNDFDVLLISPGNIKLEGYPYGFIGGCCGLIGSKTLAFTGSLSNHPDGKNIMKFLSKHKVNTVFLSEGPLIDIGGIVPLKEY